MRVGRVGLRGLLAVLLIGGVLTLVGVSPASAAPPAISVSPTSVRAWGTTTVTTTGFPAGAGKIGICPAWVRGATDPSYDDECGILATYASGLPAQAEVTVPYVFEYGSGSGHWCYDDCVIAAWVDAGSPGDPPSVAFADISIAPPTVTVSPDRGLFDGDAITVSGSGLPAGPVRAAVCAGEMNIEGFGGCRELASGVVDASGEVSIQTTIPLDEPSERCSGFSCSVGLWVGEPDDGFGFSTQVAVGPPMTPYVGSGPYPSPAHLSVWYSGFHGGPPTITVCALPLGADLASSNCQSPGETTWNDLGWGYAEVDLVVSLQGSQGVVDCLVRPCAIAGFTADGTAATSVPITFTPTPRMTLSPGDELVDGDLIQVDVDGLLPGQLVRMGRCLADRSSVTSGCERSLLNGPELSADQNGHFEIQIPAASRLTTGAWYGQRVCRAAECTVAIADNLSDVVLAEEPYGLAEPSASVSPSSGLADGQAVTVTGTDLQPSYAGPTVLFPTGGWSVAQCDRSVVDDPSLWNVFTKCAVVPGGLGVSVNGRRRSCRPRRPPRSPTRSAAGPPTARPRPTPVSSGSPAGSRTPPSAPSSRRSRSADAPADGAAVGKVRRWRLG